MAIKCPICKDEVEKGRLYGDRYMQKWLPEKKKLFMGIWALSAEKVDSRNRKQKFLARPFINGYKCANCKKIILDIQIK